ncbi:hypothetical protein JHK87_006521 [Glycine soja]|nr:hypothetical protein JHK87_006521 [Glycine soja]
MPLKGSLSKLDWLSEAYPLSEEACSLSENKTLENVEPESSMLGAQPVRLARTLSFLALSASKPS